MTDYIFEFLKKHENILKIVEYFLYIKRKLKSKKVDENILNNIEWFTEYNIPIWWFYEKKQKWISWIARLKNADHFLELCIESHLPFLDELILVDNQSADKTKEICKKLAKKYPKIKFYEYPFNVFPPSENNDKIPANSVHSLAYYYNRCFSKSKYSHVMKVDDDNLLVAEKWDNIRKVALESNDLSIYYWINLIKDEKWDFKTIKWHEYLWYFWDHYIYKVTPYTFFLQSKICEHFQNNLKYRRCWFSFFHLKFLKPDLWYHNLNGWLKKNIIKWLKSSNLCDFTPLIKWQIDLNYYLWEIDNTLGYNYKS